MSRLRIALEILWGAVLFVLLTAVIVWGIVSGAHAGGSRDFNGTSDKLGITTAALTAPPATLGCWFNSDGLAAAQVFIGITDKDNTLRYTDVSANGATGGDPVQILTQDFAAAGNARTTTAYSANTWHHGVGTQTSTSNRVAFIDAGSNPSPDTTTVAWNSYDSTHIGVRGDSTPGLFFNGEIAHCAIWDVVLTDVEIQYLALGIPPLYVRPASLKGYWPVWGSSDPEPDLDGDTGDMAVTGTTTSSGGPPVWWPAPGQ